MAQAVLSQILDGITTLNAEEMRAVECAAQERLRQQTLGYSPEEWGVLQSLLQAGLLTEIKPKKQTHSVVERPSITITGKPLSETIIEERRQWPVFTTWTPALCRSVIWRKQVQPGCRRSLIRRQDAQLLSSASPV